MDSWLVAFVGIQLTFFAFLIWLTAHYRHKRLERRSQERLRILERFNSGQELSDFLDTEQGRRFLALFALKARNPAGVIIAGSVVGVLALFIGAAFFYLIEAEDSNFLVPAVLILSGAVGVLAATVLSFLLARRFHILPPAEERQPDVLDVD